MHSLPSLTLLDACHALARQPPLRRLPPAFPSPPPRPSPPRCSLPQARYQLPDEPSVLHPSQSLGGPTHYIASHNGDPNASTAYLFAAEKSALEGTAFVKLRETERSCVSWNRTENSHVWAERCAPAGVTNHISPPLPRRSPRHRADPGAPSKYGRCVRPLRSYLANGRSSWLASTLLEGLDAFESISLRVDRNPPPFDETGCHYPGPGYNQLSIAKTRMAARNARLLSADTKATDGGSAAPPTNVLQPA